ncbi:MAG: cob(I)yrinic acid a,c-diamide adenosyltransferase [Fidelibacterota bacterium]
MRITKVTTKTGDSGRTRLGTRETVAKSDPMIHALGELDEFNTFMGWLAVIFPDGDRADMIRSIQQDLFNLGGELSLQGKTQLLDEERIETIERQSEELNEHLPPLTEFVIPGGSELVARIQINRAICRRVERAICGLDEALPRRDIWIRYLNRLSDWLFVFARYEVQDKEVDEIQWQR